MPKKTKKEKIIAEYRRKLSLVHTTPSVSPQSSPSHAVSESSLYHIETQEKKLPESSKQPTITIPASEFAFIKHDLITTLCMAAGIIIVELALWKFLPM